MTLDKGLREPLIFYIPHFFCTAANLEGSHGVILIVL